jgi:tetratricopeptide (TPR) repeat protein
MASEIQYGQGLEVEPVVLHDLLPNLTVTLTNIGQIHRQRGESTEALKVYKKAIAIQVKSIGETHPTRSLTTTENILLRCQ